jgi:hypothetical protein
MLLRIIDIVKFIRGEKCTYFPTEKPKVKEIAKNMLDLLLNNGDIYNVGVNYIRLCVPISPGER